MIEVRTFLDLRRAFHDTKAQPDPPGLAHLATLARTSRREEELRHNRTGVLATLDRIAATADVGVGSNPAELAVIFDNIERDLRVLDHAAACGRGQCGGSTKEDADDDV